MRDRLNTRAGLLRAGCAHGVRAVALDRAVLMRRVLAGMSAVLALAALLWLATAQLPAHAADAPLVASNPQLEARMLAITTELRCLVCQNQTIADSHAPLADDLRQQTRELIEQGRTDAEIVAYMTERYGDFVLYRPPFKATTALLWLGPAVLLVGGLVTLVLILRRRARLSPDRFEPEPEDDAGAGLAGDATRTASN
jgi:cytochrome c-type biogenesis protein CcmH